MCTVRSYSTHGLTNCITSICRQSLASESAANSQQRAMTNSGLDDSTRWPARGSNVYTRATTADTLLPSTSAPAASFDFPLAMEARSRSPASVQAHTVLGTQRSQWISQSWSSQSNDHGSQPPWAAITQVGAAPSFQNFQQTAYPYSVPFRQSYSQAGDHRFGAAQVSPNFSQYPQHYPSNAPHTAFQEHP